MILLSAAFAFEIPPSIANRCIMHRDCFLDRLELDRESNRSLLCCPDPHRSNEDENFGRCTEKRYGAPTAMSPQRTNYHRTNHGNHRQQSPLLLSANVQSGRGSVRDHERRYGCRDPLTRIAGISSCRHQEKKDRVQSEWMVCRKSMLGIFPQQISA